MQKRVLLLLTILLFLSFNDVKSDTNDDEIKSIIKQLTLDEKILLMNSDESPIISRLNIPFYNWHNECLHGVISSKATIFPQAIGLAASFNPNLVLSVADGISTEARIINRTQNRGLNFWSPNINILRDPRWGRGQETYGEDPFLTSIIAYNYIRGLEGTDSLFLKAIASPKHYLVHSGPEAKRHTFDAIVNEYDFRNTYLAAFKYSIQKAKVHSLMTAYNAINDSAVSASYNYLNGIVRDEFGFDGFVVSDCGALGDAYWGHWCSYDINKAASMALYAGVDLECSRFWLDNLKNSVITGFTEEKQIDTSVYRLLKARYKLGVLGDNSKCKYNNIPDSLLCSYTHKMLSTEAARQSIVLLKNNSVLPLKKDLNNIMVAGPLADVFFDLWGDYSAWCDSTVRILQGIKSKVSSETNVNYIKGSEIVGNLFSLLDTNTTKSIYIDSKLKAEYYENITFSGTPKYIQEETFINMNNHFYTTPAELRKDSFSVRWSGKIKVNETETFSLVLLSDDGGKLIINGDTIISDWISHGYRRTLSNYFFNKDSIYDIEILYYQINNVAQVRLEAASVNTLSETMATELIKNAENSDVIIYAGGISHEYEGEESPLEVQGFDKGDKTSLELPIIQQSVLKLLKQTGKPIVLVLIGGSCFTLNWENENIDAIIDTWYPGQEAGNAIADVLFGDYNPAGRLPITFYKSINDLPDFEDYNMINRTYRYFDKEVLYPFGYGLSYTKFDYSDLTSPKDTFYIEDNDTIKFYYNIKNSGNYNGDEVIQVYSNNLDKKIAKEIKSLKGFKRIHILKDETLADSILIPIENLEIYNPLKKKYVVETGNYVFEIGASSKDIRLHKNIFIKSRTSDTNIEKTDDKIYPIPATQNIKFELNSLIPDNYIINVIDAIGKKVNGYESTLTMTNTFSIDISNLSQGTYIVEIKSSKNRYYKKFVVAK